MFRNNRVSLRVKLIIFIVFFVCVSVVSTVCITYQLNRKLIEDNFSVTAYNSASSFAVFLDADFLKELRELVESEEYQQLRDLAEEQDDEHLIQQYLEEHGMWDKYCEQRELLNEYLRSRDDITYLYVIVWGSVDDDHDMYLLDDADTSKLYETGYYEEREDAFDDLLDTVEIPPTVSTGPWGYLCSAYKPIYDSDGNVICHVGCDIDMVDIRNLQRRNLMIILSASIGIMLIMIAVSIKVMQYYFIRHIDDIVNSIDSFLPNDGDGEFNLNITVPQYYPNDELGDIYHAINSMEQRIINQIKSINTINTEKVVIATELESVKEKVVTISKDAYIDPLTGVSSKMSYANDIKDLNRDILHNKSMHFAVVMCDVNRLKYINDTYGHAYGDIYLKGCCQMICDAYAHSKVYRIGGDEFIIILFGKDYSARFDIFESLRESIMSSSNDVNADVWNKYSIAVGMAEFGPADRNFESVFKRADKAMYREKATMKKTLDTNH